MATDNAHLSMLIDTANRAELRYFALGVTNSLGYTSPAEARSAGELQGIEQALIVWKAAQQALDAYKAGERWATIRD